MEYDCNWRYPTIEYEEGKEIFLLEFFPLFFFIPQKLRKKNVGVTTTTTTEEKKKTGDIFFIVTHNTKKGTHYCLLHFLFSFF